MGCIKLEWIRADLSVWYSISTHNKSHKERTIIKGIKEKNVKRVDAYQFWMQIEMYGWMHATWIIQ